VGLFGELSLLKQIGKEIGIDAGFDFWKGHDGSIHDFERENLGIEVKSTTASVPKEISVSSISQLSPAFFPDLYLIVTHLTENFSSGYSLDEIVAEVKNLLSEAKRSEFDDCLLNVGYVKRQSKKYEKRYKVEKMLCYKLEDTFPHISMESLVNGITDVTYKLSLAAIRSFEIDFEEIVEELSNDRRPV